MGYLAKLKQDTQAHVSRPRQPAWLQTMPQIAETSEVHLVPPSDGAPDLAHNAVKDIADTAYRQPAIKATKEADTSDDPYADNAPIEPTQQSFATEPMELSRGFRSSTQPTAKQAQQPQSIDSPLPEQKTTSALLSTPQVAIKQIQQLSLQTAEKASQAVAAKTSPTLSEILAEVERRQSELHRRDRRESSFTSNRVLPDSKTLSPFSFERMDDGVSLSIGSIVVEMEPEPPRPAPRPTVRSRRRGQDRDWARSFMDRW